MLARFVNVVVHICYGDSKIFNIQLPKSVALFQMSLF